MRGRKPTPAALRKLKGRSHHKQKPGTVPVVPVGVPDIPAQIAMDPYAVAAWQQWKEVFLEMNVLTKKDFAALAVLADAWATMWKANEIIAKHGVVIVRKRRYGTQVINNPAFSVKTKAWSTIVKVSSEFGLTPASLQRVRESITKPETGTPAAGEETAEGFLFGSRRAAVGESKVLPMKRR